LSNEARPEQRIRNAGWLFIWERQPYLMKDAEKTGKTFGMKTRENRIKRTRISFIEALQKTFFYCLQF